MAKRKRKKNLVEDDKMTRFAKKEREKYWGKKRKKNLVEDDKMLLPRDQILVFTPRPLHPPALVRPDDHDDLAPSDFGQT